MVVVVDDDGGGICGPISLRFVLRESKVLLLLLVYEFCDESELYDLSDCAPGQFRGVCGYSSAGPASRRNQH